MAGHHTKGIIDPPIDNLLDRDHVGSVIVNEGNGRFYEPGGGRGWLVGLHWAGR